MADTSPKSQATEKIVIIGAGAAGLTAAIYAARANMKPLVIAGIQPGGQMTITTDVENYPGFAEVINGPHLMQQMQAQAEKVGARVKYDEVAGVDFASRPFTISCEGGEDIKAETVVIATGAQARWLGLDSEQALSGKGVSACATCDGSFYKDREVVVVGGGNVAVEEAIYLSNICKKVTLVHRRDSLRAENIMQEKLKKTGNIDIMWNRVVDEILGDPKGGGVTGVRLASTNGEASVELDAHGVFIAIGHDPATAIFKGVLEMDEAGYIKTTPGTPKTGIEGVFAAGDCVDKIYRQAVTAAGMGCMAALDAERWLTARE